MRGPADFCVSIDWYFATHSSRRSSFKLSVSLNSSTRILLFSMSPIALTRSCSSGRDVDAVPALPLQRWEAHRRPLALPDVPVRDCNTTHIASSELPEGTRLAQKTSHKCGRREREREVRCSQKSRFSGSGCMAIRSGIFTQSVSSGVGLPTTRGTLTPSLNPTSSAQEARTVGSVRPTRRWGRRGCQDSPRAHSTRAWYGGRARRCRSENRAECGRLRCHLRKSRNNPIS